MARTKLQTKQAALYRTIWRWHFYAGLFCIPFIITLSISGAIYLFKPQIEQWNEAPHQNLEIGNQRLRPNALINAAIEAVPDSKFANYRLPRSEGEAIKIGVVSKGEKMSVFVNPYTQEVLEVVAVEEKFISIVRNFHGELLSGTTGSVLVEIAGCWAIVLIITGLYLWWPRSNNGLGGILYPRLKLKGRQLWKDLHSVIGIWASCFTLFLLISGLPWTLVWGGAFKEIRSFNYENINLDWSSGRKQEKAGWETNSVSIFNLQPELILLAQSLNFKGPVELSVSNETENIWKLKSNTQNRPLRQDAWLDGNNATVLKTQEFSDKVAIDKVIGYSVAAHEGQLFGWFNQLLGILTSLALLTISISGIVMWWQRKPESTLGAPPPLVSPARSKAVILITLALATVLPVLLISLVGLFIIEQCILKRITPVKNWLGLAQ